MLLHTCAAQGHSSSTRVPGTVLIPTAPETTVNSVVLLLPRALRLCCVAELYLWAYLVAVRRCSEQHTLGELGFFHFKLS